MERKVNLKEVRDQFYQYALGEHAKDIQAILEDTGDSTRHIPIYVNFLTLTENCAVLTDLLRTSGSQVLPALDLALTRAARHVYGRLTDAGAVGLTLKTRLHARLIELPVCAELQRTCVPRTEDEGRLLCVSGTVVRAGLPHLLETRAHYTCNKCKHQFTVTAEYEQSYQTERPFRCPNPQPCRAGSGFTPVSAADAGLRDHQARDYQEIRLQEQVQKLDVGKIPRGLCVVLEDDLVDLCKAGDDVIVTGTVRQRWRSTVRGSPPDIEMTLHANRVFVNSEQRTSLLLTEDRLGRFAEFWRRHRHDPMAGRNHILQRFCSQIYGMYVVKLAVALTLVGGVRRTDGTSATRGEPHLLMIGDPGTGKSQLLKYAARLCARSVLTTGIGSTSAGLTCAAVKEGAEWQLEAGALVLADGGVCCIDEFNSVREADKTSIHEAMEQQTISVAKAGMVCKLNTRCSILAAANPRLPVDWESGDDVLSKLGLGSPLLSRFDLILVLKDARSTGWDKLVSGYILSGLNPLAGQPEPTEEGDWGLETLQAYLAHVRTIQPQPDRQAATVLQTYYQLLRGQETAGRSRTTVRLLESLLRLAQAHARLRCSASGAQLCDAVVAITLMEASLGGLGGGLLGPDGVGSILHTGFPDNPADEYRAQCELVLGRLGLDELLAAELRALDERQTLGPDDSLPDRTVHTPPRHSGEPCSDGGHDRPATLFGSSGAAADDTANCRSGDLAGDGTDCRSGDLAGDVTDCRGNRRRSELADATTNLRPREPAGGATNFRPSQLAGATTNLRPGEPAGGTANVPASARAGDLHCRTADMSAGDTASARSDDNSARAVLNTTADFAPAVASNATGASAAQRSRYAGLKARVAPSESAADGRESLTRIRPPEQRTDVRPAGRSGTEAPLQDEPPAQRPLVRQFDRFKFVKPAAVALGSTRPHAAAKTPSFCTSLDSLVADMDDDFESSLSGRTLGGGGGVRTDPPAQSGVKRGRAPDGRKADSRADERRAFAPDRGVWAGGAPDRGARTGGAGASADSVVSGVTPSPASTAGERAASSRRPLSASTLGKLARFSVDPDPAPESRGADTAPLNGVSDLSRDRTAVTAGSESWQAGGGGLVGTGCSQFESADDACLDLELDFSWPPSKRVKS